MDLQTLANDPAVRIRLDNILHSVRDYLPHGLKENTVSVSGKKVVLPDIVVKYLHQYPNEFSFSIIEKYLTKGEADIFQKLLDNIGHTVTKEELAAALWNKRSDAKYSEWAIYKMMGGLRNKIKKYSVAYSIVSTRSKGYTLNPPIHK